MLAAYGRDPMDYGWSPPVCLAPVEGSKDKDGHHISVQPLQWALWIEEACLNITQPKTLLRNRCEHADSRVLADCGRFC